MSKGMNKDYRNDPERILGRVPIIASFLGRDQQNKLKQVSRNKTGWFNLVPDKSKVGQQWPRETNVTLNIVDGSTGMFGQRHPIQAHYVHYASSAQQAAGTPVQFVVVRRNFPTHKFVFSAGLSGCSIAVVKPHGRRDILCFYHDSRQSIPDREYFRTYGEVIEKVEFKDYMYRSEPDAFDRQKGRVEGRYTGLGTPVGYFRGNNWYLAVQDLRIIRTDPRTRKDTYEVHNLIVHRLT